MIQSPAAALSTPAALVSALLARLGRNAPPPTVLIVPLRAAVPLIRAAGLGVPLVLGLVDAQVVTTCRTPEGGTGLSCDMTRLDAAIEEVRAEWTGADSPLPAMLALRDALRALPLRDPMWVPECRWN